MPLGAFALKNVKMDVTLYFNDRSTLRVSDEEYNKIFSVNSGIVTIKRGREQINIIRQDIADVKGSVKKEPDHHVGKYTTKSRKG